MSSDTSKCLPAYENELSEDAADPYQAMGTKRSYDE
jgi:hypothetical protein